MATSIFRPTRLSATRTACGSCTFSSVTITACETSAAGSEELAGPGDIPTADFDVVAALGQFDADSLRGEGHGVSYGFCNRSRSAAVTVIRRQKPV